MPIVGMTDDITKAKMPRIAKLVKGGEKETKTNSKGETYQTWGKDLDYFRVKFYPEYEQYEEEWANIYGDKPKVFEEVFTTHATVDESFETWREEYDASQTLMHRCDEQHQVLWYSKEYQTQMTAKVSCVAKTSGCECTRIGKLHLIIPEFIAMTGIYGEVVVETGSINDIITLYNMLAHIQRANGTLLGVPFVLGRQDRKIPAPDKKNNRRIKVTKSLFFFYVEPTYMREELLPRMARAGGLLSANQPMLPQPTPQLDKGIVKTLLNSGSGERRMGVVEPVTTVLPASEPTTEPAAPNTPPATAVPPPAAEQTIIGIDTVGNAMGKLKTRALKELFNGKDTKAMNDCVSRLTQEGKLPPIMTLDQAMDVIKNAHCPQAEPQNSNETVIQSAPLPNMPAVAEPM